MAQQIASVAVGVVNGSIVADLDYDEDYDSDVDCNLVFTGSGDLIEVQGTAEGQPFSPADLTGIVTTGWSAAQQVLAAQRAAIAERLRNAGIELP